MAGESGDTSRVDQRQMMAVPQSSDPYAQTLSNPYTPSWSGLSNLNGGSASDLYSALSPYFSSPGSADQAQWATLPDGTRVQRNLLDLGSSRDAFISSRSPGSSGEGGGLTGLGDAMGGYYDAASKVDPSKRYTYDIYSPTATVGEGAHGDMANITGWNPNGTLQANYRYNDQRPDFLSDTLMPGITMAALAAAGGMAGAGALGAAGVGAGGAGGGLGSLSTADALSEFGGLATGSGAPSAAGAVGAGGTGAFDLGGVAGGVPGAGGATGLGGSFGSLPAGAVYDASLGGWVDGITGAAINPTTGTFGGMLDPVSVNASLAPSAGFNAAPILTAGAGGMTAAQMAQAAGSNPTNAAQIGQQTGDPYYTDPQSSWTDSLPDWAKSILTPSNLLKLGTSGLGLLSTLKAAGAKNSTAGSGSLGNGAGLSVNHPTGQFASNLSGLINRPQRKYNPYTGNIYNLETQGGGWNYFPTTPAMAHGGSTSGLGHMGPGFVAGPGDGQSDSVQAKLADGEYVMDADVVSALGNGSNQAGAEKLDQFRENIRKHKRSAPTGDIPPPAKSINSYMGK